MSEDRELTEAVHAWLRDDTSLAVKMNITPEAVAKLVERLARPPAIGVEAAPWATCQDCGGVIEGWICQSCDREFEENDAGYLVFAALPSVPVGGLGASLRDTHRATDAAVVASVTLEGRQGDPAGMMTVTLHMSDGREVPIIRDNGNIISHWARVDAAIQQAATSDDTQPGTDDAPCVGSAPSLPTEDAAGGFCGCNRCVEEAVEADGGGPFDTRLIRMFLCSICGNKRCPHAADHRNTCTNSNEPGQPGSSYPAAPTTPASLDGGA